GLDDAVPRRERRARADEDAAAGPDVCARVVAEIDDDVGRVGRRRNGDLLPARFSPTRDEAADGDHNTEYADSNRALVHGDDLRETWAPLHARGQAPASSDPRDLWAHEPRRASYVMRVFGISWIAGYPQQRDEGFIGEAKREDDRGIPLCVLLASCAFHHACTRRH